MRHESTAVESVIKLQTHLILRESALQVCDLSLCISFKYDCYSCVKTAH